MRSMHVYRALDQISNRFALCMNISRGVRLLHKNGNSMGSTVTSTMAGIESNKVLRVSALPLRHLPAVELPLPATSAVVGSAGYLVT